MSKPKNCLTCMYRRELAEAKRKLPEAKRELEAAEAKARLWDRFLNAMTLACPSKNEDLRLADMRANVQQDELFDVLKGYLDSFDGVSRRLEATYNLMRYLRREAIDLQPQTQEAAG